MLKGKGVSEGIGLGKAIILKNEEIKPQHTKTNYQSKATQKYHHEEPSNYN